MFGRNPELAPFARVHGPHICTCSRSSSPYFVDGSSLKLWTGQKKKSRGNGYRRDRSEGTSCTGTEKMEGRIMPGIIA